MKKILMNCFLVHNFSSNESLLRNKIDTGHTGVPFLSIKRNLYLLIVLIFSLDFFSCNPDPYPDVRLNERFNPKEPSQLSPPVIAKPIHECAEAVHVTTFIPHAEITVYANGSEVIGAATPPFGFADITLNRPLKLGESITATQKVNSLTSSHSIQPVIVSAYPTNAFSKPKVGADLYDCGVIVPVGDLVPSVRVHVFEDGTEVGSGPTAGAWLPVWTSALHAGKKVTAVQTACENESGKTITSPVSDPITVKPAPDPVPSPTCDGNTIYPGNDAVALGNLFVGAFVTVKDNGTVIGSGYVTAGANWVPLSQPLTNTSSITAVQELCGKTSAPSSPVTPTGKLTAPLVLDPICAGSRFVVVRNTIINASVVVLRNGGIVGYAGAVNGDLVVSLGGNTTLSTGDKITAYQYMGSNISPVSNSVTVVASVRAPSLEITGGEPFFLPEEGEKAIDGPVFPRGKGDGPHFLVQACCDKKVTVEIKGPGGLVVNNPVVDEVFPGYYSATWNWQSASGWAIPAGIPVGEYTATVHSECSPENVTKKFYVIFNPDDVGGPARFSYDETGVWFGTGSNQTIALLYYLHPDDARVFNLAIKAASGQTDPAAAAALVSDAEEGLFSYSLNFHTKDVIDMIENYDDAQCADDANVLTAMFRAIGIPSHPATADADLETGDAGWTFDTWTEFLVPGNPQPQWLILHPHQYPAMNAETRSVFGGTQDVAVKSFNDIVVMAGTGWIWSEAGDGSFDVSFGRTSCTEPEQTLTKKSWIDEICEQGYWNPSHWDCSGLGTSSSGLQAESFNVNMGDAGYGRTISGTIIFRNTTNRRIDATPLIGIAGDLIESKKFPDTLYERSTLRVSVAPNDTVSVPFRLRLPVSSLPGHRLHLQVVTGRNIVAVHPFRLEGALKSELRMSDTLRVGSEINITATVTNNSKQIVNGISVDLNVPYAIRITEGDYKEAFSLQPGTNRIITWRARVIAPMDAGTIQVRTGSSNGGADEIARAIQIPGTANTKIERSTIPKKGKQ